MWMGEVQSGLPIVNELGTCPALCPLIRVLFAIHYLLGVGLSSSESWAEVTLSLLWFFLVFVVGGSMPSQLWSPFIWSLAPDKEFQSSSWPLRLPPQPSLYLPRARGIYPQFSQMCASSSKTLVSSNFFLFPPPLTLRLHSFPSNLLSLSIHLSYSISVCS